MIPRVSAAALARVPRDVLATVPPHMAAELRVIPHGYRQRWQPDAGHGAIRPMIGRRTRSPRTPSVRSSARWLRLPRCGKRLRTHYGVFLNKPGAPASGQKAAGPPRPLWPPLPSQRRSRCRQPHRLRQGGAGRGAKPAAAPAAAKPAAAARQRRPNQQLSPRRLRRRPSPQRSPRRLPRRLSPQRLRRQLRQQTRALSLRRRLPPRRLSLRPSQLLSQRKTAAAPAAAAKPAAAPSAQPAATAAKPAQPPSRQQPSPAAPAAPAAAKPAAQPAASSR